MIEVSGVTVFSSDADPSANSKFLRWKEDHSHSSNALYLNIKTSSKAMIHRADCRHAFDEADGDNARHPKACCLMGHGRLREFAKENKLEVETCGTCGVHW